MSLYVCDVCVRTIRLFVHTSVCLCMNARVQTEPLLYVYSCLFASVVHYSSIAFFCPACAITAFLTNWFVCVCVFDVLGGFMEI